MLIMLVFIEQNCTFNLEVSGLCVYVSMVISPQAPLALYGMRWPRIIDHSLEVGQRMPNLA